MGDCMNIIKQDIKQISSSQKPDNWKVFYWDIWCQRNKFNFHIMGDTIKINGKPPQDPSVLLVLPHVPSQANEKVKLMFYWD